MLLATCSLCTKTCDTQTCCCCRAIARGAVAALAFCHERGVAHGSLGAASFLLSTFDDRRAAELIVKLDNFGFARMLHRPRAPDGEADEGALPSQDLPRRPHVRKRVCEAYASAIAPQRAAATGLHLACIMKIMQTNGVREAGLAVRTWDLGAAQPTGHGLPPHARDHVHQTRRQMAPRPQARARRRRQRCRRATR